MQEELGQRDPWTRRSFLMAGSILGVGAGLTACTTEDSPEPTPSATRESASPTGPFSTAMHVHSCFSEGAGSMQSQLAEATRLGVDVLWWTDHDWRMQAVQYWEEISFEDPVIERNGIGWRWQLAGPGEAKGKHEFRTPTSDLDPGETSKALHLSQEFDNDSITAYSLKAVADRDTYRTSLSGQRLDIDVYPEELSGNGYLAFDLITSFRPAIGDRDAGTYRLSYRVGGDGQPGSAVPRGRLGVITQEAPVGQWSTLSFEPAADIQAIWPEIDGRDACSFDIIVAVQASQSGPASGYFAGLRFQRADVAGDAPLATQQALMDLYRDEFGDVTQLPGTEVSLTNPHLGAYGGDLSIPIEPDDELGGVLSPQATRELVSRIQAQGSLVSYNHPFGTSNEIAAPADQQQRMQQAATDLVQEQMYGADMVEVGYRSRGGIDLAGHLLIWDACSRAGVFVTGIGVNDNHSGMGWDTAENNFITWIWAEEPSLPALSTALSGGRAYFGDPTQFNGQLDLSTAAGAQMGQVEVSADHGAELLITVSDLPSGWSVDLVSLDMVDAASGGTPQGPPTESDYSRVSLTGQDFSDSRAQVPIDPAAEQVHRLEVIDPTGVIMASSNPIWLLSGASSVTVPAERTP